MDNPNEIIYVWLEEWYKEANSRSSKSAFALKKAMVSLKSATEPIRSSKKAMELAYFGEGICKKIEKKIGELYQSQPNLAALLFPSIINFIELAIDAGDNIVIEEPKKKTTRETSYRPRYKSPGYAILLALHVNGNKPMILRSLIGAAKQYSNEQATDEKLSSAIRLLVNKGLVHKVTTNYFLSDDGVTLATTLIKGAQCMIESFGEKDLNENPVECAESIVHSIDDLTIEEKYKIMSEYRIILCLDSRERIHNNDRFYIQEQLEKNNIHFSTRMLELGDFLWIARDNKGNEIALDYIIERKRMDDLHQSIRDGRYQEQKNRLRNCGISNAFYIVEKYNAPSFEDPTIQSQIQSALITTQIVDKLMLKLTQSIDATIAFILLLNKKIHQTYENRPIFYVPDHLIRSRDINDIRREISPTIDLHMTVSTFSYMSAKSNITLGDVFVKQLMRIRGLTYDKASQIVEKYPTPLALYKAYQQSDAKMTFFENFPNQALRFGKVLSTRMGQLFTEQVYTESQ